MKKITLSTLFMLFILIAKAQNVAINNNGAAPDASAMLDISSSSKGVLIPRLTTPERTSIVSPARGLLVYDSDTQSFWYWTGLGWKEILNNSSIVPPQGPASGDLSGTYPAPNVVKIQNLDVAFGVPGNKQVMKWDMMLNKWIGQNDSLFLPYNVSFGDPAKLFGITNTNTTNGATAIYGKGGTGSGVPMGTTAGVWGDNANGIGVVGTSNAGVGTYGVSLQNYGVYGYTAGNDFAGVYGANANSGYGIYGEIYNAGVAVYGKSNGTTGKAGYFRLLNSTNTDTAFAVINDGLGKALSISSTNASQNLGVFSIDNAGSGQMITLTNSNSTNNAHMIFANQTGTGAGLYISVANTLNNHPGIVVEHAGIGTGIESYGFKGKAGLFQIPAAANANEALNVSTAGTGNGTNISISNLTSTADAANIITIGKGSAGYFKKDNTTGSISDIHKPAVMIDNNSKGNALKISSLHTPSVNAGVQVDYDGQAYGVSVTSTHGGMFSLSSSNTMPALQASNLSGGPAIKALSSGFEPTIYAENSITAGQVIKAMSTATNSSTNAVLGIANTGSLASGAVHGINNGGGAGVAGVSNSAFGVGVFGGTSGGGFAGYFEKDGTGSGGNALSVIDQSTGVPAYILAGNNASSSAALEINHLGTGKLISLKSNSEKFSVANNGNVTSSGTVTVKGNKGIIRNSNATQMRMETITADLIYFNMPVGGSVSTSVTFATSFNTVPVVSLANIQSGFTGPCDKMTVQVKNVTTTGCTVVMYNPGISGNPNVSGTWNLLAIGAE